MAIPMNPATSQPRATVTSPRELEIDWDDRRVRIEHAWIDGSRDAPLVVFLHEGLGCVAMWRDFPARLCAAVGARGLVYSRPGYGDSSGPTERHRDVDYLHRQAHEVLPRVLDALGVKERVWLFGHSDGGSIALLFAARFPARVAGVVVVAPHILVEEVTVQGVRAALEAYGPAQRERLARYHADADAVFHAWTGIWLDARFRSWNIERDIEAIAAPVLALQGLDDEYATLEQVRGIARRVAVTRVVELAQCGHSPQRDQPDAVIGQARAFMALDR
jgi:pimeloyl-ACP methyl ester carboxylesterase